MKSLSALLFILVSTISFNAIASICTIQGKVTSIEPSSGVAGLSISTPLTGCVCDSSRIWIDTESNGGKAMYSAALAAKMADKNIQVTVEDGKGQGTAGNTSVTHRYWASCKLHAFQVL